MSKKAILAATIIGLIFTAAITIFTRLDQSWSWIAVLCLGLANDIANVIIDYFGGKK